jgi:hypothetical protein
MNRKPALIRQCEARRIIAAAKKVGAKNVEVKLGEISVIVHLDDEKPFAEDEEVKL